MKLTQSEKKFIDKIENWEKRVKKVENIFYNILLVLGGILLISVVIVTIENLNNPNIIWIALPGILIGVHFVWLFLMGKYWIKERTYIASILKKIYQDKT